MKLIVAGKEIERTATGFLVNAADWSEEVANELAKEHEVELTQQHWDIINYLREEYFNNNENIPNTRTIVKAMKEKWPDCDVAAGTLYGLFPKDPSKQGGMIAGLPESRRKGGY